MQLPPQVTGVTFYEKECQFFLKSGIYIIICNPKSIIEYNELLLHCIEIRCIKKLPNDRDLNCYLCLVYVWVMSQWFPVKCVRPGNTVESTLHPAHITLYTTPCTHYNVHYTLHTLRWTLHRAHITMYTTTCKLCTLQYVHYRLYTTCCTLHSVEYSVMSLHPFIAWGSSLMCSQHCTAHCTAGYYTALHYSV